MFLILAGHPATGKTTLSEKLKAIYPDHTLLHTDDYMEHGYKESVYKLIEDLESHKFHNVIVEGIMGARLMRKLQELHEKGLNVVLPIKSSDGSQRSAQFPVKVDLYIYISTNLDTITDVYTRERPDKSISSIVSTCKGLDTVNQSIDKSTLPHLEVHINGSAHEIIHNAILHELK